MMAPQSRWNEMTAREHCEKDVCPVSPSRSKKALCRKRVNKAVRFDTEVHVHKVLHVNDMSPEEIEASWFTQDQYNRMKSSVQEIARMMTKFECAKNVCTRGLGTLIYSQ